MYCNLKSLRYLSCFFKFSTLHIYFYFILFAVIVAKYKNVRYQSDNHTLSKLCSFIRVGFCDSIDLCTVAESCLFHHALEIISNEMQHNLFSHKGLNIVQFHTVLTLLFLLEGYEMIICTTIQSSAFSLSEHLQLCKSLLEKYLHF